MLEGYSADEFADTLFEIDFVHNHLGQVYVRGGAERRCSAKTLRMGFESDSDPNVPKISRRSRPTPPPRQCRQSEATPPNARRQSFASAQPRTAGGRRLSLPPRTASTRMRCPRALDHRHRVSRRLFGGLSDGFSMWRVRPRDIHQNGKDASTPMNQSQDDRERRFVALICDHVQGIGYRRSVAMAVS